MSCSHSNFKYSMKFQKRRHNLGSVWAQSFREKFIRKPLWKPSAVSVWYSQRLASWWISIVVRCGHLNKTKNKLIWTTSLLLVLWPLGFLKYQGSARTHPLLRFSSIEFFARGGHFAWPESTWISSDCWLQEIRIHVDSPDLTSRADYLVKGQQSPSRDLIWR